LSRVNGNRMANERLRSLPSVERLLARPAAMRLAAQLGRNHVRDLLRDILDGLRKEEARTGVAANGDGAGTDCSPFTPDSLLSEIERRLEARGGAMARPSLRRVINATGVILHTNLGRAPLAGEAIDALSDVAAHYSNLEYDLERGERGQREAHCQERLARLASSEAALVVNNNAAAVLLVLNTLAEGGEVVVSRGELVEIGGSFRVPDVMVKAGAVLREVGTTNRTRIADYERAITERTRLLLRVDRSNFAIVGFTEQPALEELAALGRKHHIPVMEDLGGGAFLPLRSLGINESGVLESLRAGVDLVTYSGDKMLGGPQAGLLSGREELIKRVRGNPLFRALRVDKLTYAALEATLMEYVRQNYDAIPFARMMRLPAEVIRERAQVLRINL